MTTFNPAVAKVLAERLLSSTAGDEDLTFADGRIAHIRRTPADGIRAIAELVADEQAQIFTLYEPAVARPTGYPPSLPHCAGVPVLVAALKEGMMALWETEVDTSRVHSAVLNQLTADGWAQGNTPGRVPGLFETATFERGTSKASLSKVMNSVILMLNPS